MTQTVTLEDGSVHAFPDDATADEMQSSLSSLSAPPQQAMGPLNVPQSLAGYTLNSVNGVPGLNLLKEAGAGIRGLAAAAQGGSFSDEYSKSKENQDKLMQAQADQQPSFHGVTPNLVGGISAGLATAPLLPTAGPTGSIIADGLVGAGEGGLYGAASGFGSGNDFSSRLHNAGNAAEFGAGMGGAAGLASGSLRSLVGAYKGIYPEARLSAAQDAMDMGVPVYKSNLSDSKLLDYLSSTSDELPGVLGGTASRPPGQLAAIGSNLTSKIGQEGTELSKEVVDGALEKTGSAIGAINAKYSVPLKNMNSDLNTLANDASSELTGDSLKLFNQRIRSIKNDAIRNNGVLPGGVYQQNRSALGKEALDTAFGSTAKYSDLLEKLQDTLDKHFAQQASPEDAAMLGPLRQQYRNAKTLQPISDKYPLGNYPLSSLNAKTVKNPDLQPIGNAAQLFKGKTGNSGTAVRKSLFEVAKSLGGLGGAAALAHEVDPDWEHNALELGGVAGAATLPGIANRMFNPGVTPFSLNGFSSLQGYSPQINWMADLLRRAPAAVPLSLAPQQGK